MCKKLWSLIELKNVPETLTIHLETVPETLMTDPCRNCARNSDHRYILKNVPETLLTVHNYIDFWEFFFLHCLYKGTKLSLCSISKEQRNGYPFLARISSFQNVCSPHFSLSLLCLFAGCQRFVNHVLSFLTKSVGCLTNALSCTYHFFLSIMPWHVAIFFLVTHTYTFEWTQ